MSGRVGLVPVATSSLERLREGLAAGRVRTPLNRSDLVAYGVRGQIDALVAALAGHTAAACLSIIDAALAERAQHDTPDAELVWTGPEGAIASARDTLVVLRELFESARKRVVLAGYAFDHAQDVLRPLHGVMQEHGVQVRFFVNLDQVKALPPDPDAYGAGELGKFLASNWPFGAPYPELYCDRRALRPAPPWCSLHAKCVAVDGERAFVSSANFTNRGQERNIETGVLLHAPAFATQLEKQWQSLVDGGLVLKGG